MPSSRPGRWRPPPACRRSPTTRDSRSMRSGEHRECGVHGTPGNRRRTPTTSGHSWTGCAGERHRSARFRTVMALVIPDGHEIVAEGVLEGIDHRRTRAVSPVSATTRSSMSTAGRWPSSMPGRRTPSATGAGPCAPLPRSSEPDRSRSVRRAGVCEANSVRSRSDRRAGGGTRTHIRLAPTRS